MQCITLKKGIECAFMTRKGCNFNGGRCHTVVESCEGCSKTVTFEKAPSAPSPPIPPQNGPAETATSPPTWNAR